MESHGINTDNVSYCKNGWTENPIRSYTKHNPRKIRMGTKEREEMLQEIERLLVFDKTLSGREIHESLEKVGKLPSKNGLSLTKRGVEKYVTEVKKKLSISGKQVKSDISKIYIGLGELSCLEKRKKISKELNCSLSHVNLVLKQCGLYRRENEERNDLQVA